jgi:hypothetical protein
MNDGNLCCSDIFCRSPLNLYRQLRKPVRVEEEHDISFLLWLNGSDYRLGIAVDSLCGDKGLASDTRGSTRLGFGRYIGSKKVVSLRLGVDKKAKATKTKGK